MTLDTLDEVLRRAAAAAPGHIAVRSGESDLSYAALHRVAGAIARGLRNLGVRRGDRVAVALNNRVEAAVAIYGVLRAGAVLVPLYPTIKSPKLEYVLTDCAAAALICEASLAEAAGQVRKASPKLSVVVAGAGADSGFPTMDLLIQHEPLGGVHAIEVDPAAIIYTSGSTGTPKGVTLTQRNMMFAVSSIADYLQMNADDRVLSVLPLSFDYGLYQLLLCTYVGATLLLESGVGYPGTLVRRMVEQQVTGLPGVPTLFRLLLGLPGFAERSWPQLRFLTSTGARLAVETIRKLRAAFPSARLYSMYGLTECKRVSYLPPAEIDRHPDSVGVPLPGTEVWIEDDAGHRLGPGQVGDLMVRGPHVMQGYWNDPAGTRARLQAGRWPWEKTLRTGDLFRRDEEGFLYFVGRRDDMIKTRGEKVYPREIEEVLLAAPGVLEAAVIGVPDEILGQAVYAHVAPQPGQTLEASGLHRFCKQRLEDHLVPARIVIHAQLPKTPNGKTDLLALAHDRAKQAAAAGRAGAS